MSKSRRRVSKEAVALDLGQGPISKVPEAVLKDLHLLTREGDLNADARRKIKQIDHFVRLLEPQMADVLKRYAEPQFVDLGSGNAYLGFVVYAAYLKEHPGAVMISVEQREALVLQSKARAAQCGYDRMQFLLGHIDEAALPERTHVVLALHACDTATDHAMLRGITTHADCIALVPCCQAEFADGLKHADHKAHDWQRLYAHALHRREFGAHLTNVFRSMVLEACGYQVTVTEVFGFEHSLKNELILARKVHRENARVKQELLTFVEHLGFEPRIWNKLGIYLRELAVPAL